VLKYGFFEPQSTAYSAEADCSTDADAGSLVRIRGLARTENFRISTSRCFPVRLDPFLMPVFVDVSQTVLGKLPRTSTSC